ncbi:stage II sporulation protein M [Vulcanisaeta distributa]|uniref:stage II sporulation protein M n=1 Tax=Vulcanisaeta distributa TaxID=164451 RepID=UPI000AF72CBB|nr:stage II sporulation protein M [Vulcanisaeta distributa]
MGRPLLYEVLNYVFIFVSGLLVGYFTLHEFLFSFNEVMIDYKINESFIKPGLPLFDIILIKNSQFSIAVFLLGFNKFIQYLVMFIAGLISGLLLSPLMPICAALGGILPHGLLELTGYALAGVGGYKYFGLHVISLRDSLVKYLLPSLVLLIIAALIEAFITLKIILIIPTCSV